MESAQTLKQFR